jgi:hypothetical protein
MGTQGLRIRVTDCWGASRGSSARLALVVTSFTLLPALAACSSFSSSPSSSAETASVPPPPYSAAPPPAMAAAPASAELGTSGYPYPSQSLVGLFKDSMNSSPQQDVPRPPSTYTPSGQPYPANQPVYAQPVAASAVPPPPANDANSYYPYPKQSLTDLFRSSTDSSPAPQPNMPHPPSTYTPSAQ